MTYRVHRSGASEFNIEGTDIKDAIEKNFKMLAKQMNIGNVAGYTLDRATIEYKPGILGGQGGIELNVVAHGSDSLVNYDPYNDNPETSTIWIYAKKEDLPEGFYEFEINREKKAETTPFDVPNSAGQALGFFRAVCEEIASNHSRFPVDGTTFSGVCANIELRFPTIKIVNPHKYVELIQQEVHRCRPKEDAQTKKLVERANELALILMDYDNKEITNDANKGIDFLASVRASKWFQDKNKITALAYYRKKAGLTGKQLAEIVGLSDRQIRNYEASDSRLCDAKNIVVENIAKALNVKPSDLVEDGVVVMVDGNKQ